jgi:hypothetical protein
MSGPRVYFSLPNSHLFDFPPRSLPRPLLPPVENSTLRSPCGISPWIFHHSMRIEIPFVFAASYIFAICYINTWNRNRGNKPWGLTLNIFWKPFITLHNVFLAVYSLTSFLAMYSTLTHTVLGWNSPAGFAGVIVCMWSGVRYMSPPVWICVLINSFIHTLMVRSDLSVSIEPRR